MSTPADIDAKGLEAFDDKLAPCPLCRSRAFMDGRWFACCTNAQCQCSTMAFGTPEQAIAAWNRRSPVSSSTGKDDEPKALWAAFSELVNQWSDGGDGVDLAPYWQQLETVVEIAASALAANAARIRELEQQIGEADNRITRLQAALNFWMPGVTKATDSGLDRSAGDDAYLLAGYSGEGEAYSCWGDDMLARITTLEARVAELEGALRPFGEWEDFPPVRDITLDHFRRARSLTGDKTDGK